MIKVLSEIFERLKSAGVEERHTIGLRLRIKMINMICMLIVFAGLLMIAFINISGFRDKLITELLLTQAFSLVILLNYFKLHNVSRIAFLLFANALMFYVTCKDVTVTGSRFYFFLLPLGTLIVFDITEKIKIIACILLSLINYLVVYFFDFSQWITPVNYPTQIISIYHYMSFAVYIIMISLMSYFFVSGYRVINNELSIEQKQFAELEKLAGVGSWRIHLPSNKIVVSDELLKIFGLDKHKAAAITPGVLLKYIHPDDRRKVFDGLKTSIINGEFNEVSYRITLPGLQTKYVTSRARPERDEEGKLKYVDGALINLTRQVEMRNALAQNLKEKETLLAEMHHRVKNNLAVISGLIQLQSFKVDEKAQQQFFEIHNKITTIALVHEKFYQSESLTKINLVNFVQELEKQIARTIPSKDCKVSTNFKIDDIYLAINYAIPTALILNELISNSYRHAFTGMHEGKILIKIQKDGDLFILHYRDNGKGLPQNIDFNDTGNQGLSLISMLVKSMHFEFAATNESGFYFTMFRSAEV